MREAYQHRPTKPVCAISGWIWLDVTASTSIHRRFQQQHGLRLSLVIARRVILDDSGTLWLGGWLRSTFLKAFHRNHIFETNQLCVLLVGTGGRLTITFDEMVQLFPASVPRAIVQSRSKHLN